MKISVTLDVPTGRWADEYGVALAEVRADFLEWLRTTLDASPVSVQVVRP